MDLKLPADAQPVDAQPVDAQPVDAQPVDATVVAVDQGKSGTRAEARVGSGASVHGAAPGFSYARVSESKADGEYGADAVIAAVQSLRLPGPPRVVSVGSTAAPATLDGRRELAAVLRSRLNAERVLVTEDSVTAHLGAFGGAAGVVVSAGTGAVALWSDGRAWARIDGWGPVLGDHGSGTDIGAAGLRAAFATLDGRGAATTLVEPARHHLGGLDLAAARRLHAGENPTEVVSEFAVAVLQAAEDGDAIAGAIVARAGHELATSAVLAAREPLARGEHPRCCAVGQLMNDALLRSTFTSLATERGLLVEVTPAGPLAGAMYLALAGPTPAFTALVGVADDARSSTGSRPSTGPHSSTGSRPLNGSPQR